MSRNIEFVVKNKMCNGCGTCVSMCPRDAIELHLNSKLGLFQPIIYKELCNTCGICYNTCPGIELNFDCLNTMVFGHTPKDVITGNYLQFYVGNTKNRELNTMCSSGGIITELLIFALENKIITGAIVTRMKKDNPFIPETFIARTKSQIIEASKSKYCPVSPNSILKEIINSDNNEKLAFVGLGCHIHGIRKAQLLNKNLSEKIYICIELFCSHTDSFLATEYVLKWHNVNQNDVLKLDYRGDGWPGSMNIEFKDGSKLMIPYKRYITVHELYIFSPERCSTCFDGIGELSDISIGDAWGIVDKDEFGKSLCITRTEKGEELIKNCFSQNRLELDTIEKEKIINSQGLLSANRIKKAKAKININKILKNKSPQYIKINLSLRPYNPTYINYIQLILLDLHKRLFAAKPLWILTYKLIDFEILLMKKLKLKK